MAFKKEREMGTEKEREVTQRKKGRWKGGGRG